MKYIILLLLLTLIKLELKAQPEIIDSNIALLNRLEVKYKTPCIKYQERKVKKKRVKIDKHLINDINEIYHAKLSFSDLINLLIEKGYDRKRRVSKPEWDHDTITFEKINHGYLINNVKIIYNVNEQRLISKKIILATKTHFFCETKEWQSNSYIDFVYLRRFILRIKIPLQVAWSNVELESKQQ